MNRATVANDAVTSSSASGRSGRITSLAPAALTFEQVSRRFATPDGTIFTAVSDIDLRVDDAQFVSIIGPSGCGKSTLLSMSAGLLAPTTGSVSCREEPIERINTDVGYMMQHDHLLPWRSVARNVSLPLEVRGELSRAEMRDRVDGMLDLVGLDGFANHYPSQLSGGMQKRVALARTLVYSPSILLMDEPFAALDAQLRLLMQQELLRLWEQERKTVMFVTHDVEEAILLADVIVVFGTRPGRIIHIEPVDLPRPRDLVSAKRDPDFVDMWERLWCLIEGEIADSESVDDGR